jgi:hypothetical protein
MSQPPQGQPSYGTDGRAPSEDPPGHAGGGLPPVPPQQPWQGWGPPAPQHAGSGWGQPSGQGWAQPPPQAGPGWGQPGPSPGQVSWGAGPGHGGHPAWVSGTGMPGQPPHAGGPSGPGGPWGRPPGGPPAGGPVAGGGNRNLVTGLIAALVVLIVAGVALIVGLGDDAPLTAATSDPTDFVALLPADFTDCAEAEPAGDGDLAAARCGASSTRPGPAEARFHLYPDVDTLDSAFEADLSAEDLTEFGPTDDCTTGTGYAEWTYTDGTPGGQVACTLTDDGHALLAWTDDEYLTGGAVRAPGTTQDDVRALYDWWAEHSDYQG